MRKDQIGKIRTGSPHPTSRMKSRLITAAASRAVNYGEKRKTITRLLRTLQSKHSAGICFTAILKLQGEMHVLQTIVLFICFVGWLCAVSCIRLGVFVSGAHVHEGAITSSSTWGRVLAVPATLCTHERIFLLARHHGEQQMIEWRARFPAQKQSGDEFKGASASLFFKLHGRSIFEARE